MKTINLNRREKYAVAVLACFIVIFLVFRLIVYLPLLKNKRLVREYDLKITELKEIRMLRADYLILQEKAGRAKANLARRNKGFSLYSFLESLARDVGIKVSSMDESSTPSQGDTNIKTSMVKLKLQAITTDQLAQYLHKVEYSGNNLFVKRMAISETTKPEGYINVTLQVETIDA